VSEHGFKTKKAPIFIGAKIFILVETGETPSLPETPVKWIDELLESTLIHAIA